MLNQLILSSGEDLQRLFIIAGNRAEYYQWVSKNRDRFPYLGLLDFIWVSDLTVFRGQTSPHGYFVGTYRQRPDLEELLAGILVCSPDLSQQERQTFIARVRGF